MNDTTPRTSGEGDTFIQEIAANTPRPPGGATTQADYVLSPITGGVIEPSALAITSIIIGGVLIVCIAVSELKRKLGRK